MLSKTGLHAALALAALAELPNGAFAGAGTIAREIGAPQNYLGKMLQTLSREGLVESQRGINGGFRLARKAEEITLQEAIEPFEHLHEWNACILGRAECSDVHPCALHFQWSQVREDYLGMLSGTTIADLQQSGEALNRL